MACFFVWQWGWRCRAKLAVRGTSDNALIGLYQEGTHSVVDIPECKGSWNYAGNEFLTIVMMVLTRLSFYFDFAAHHPNINAAIELLREGIVSYFVLWL